MRVRKAVGGGLLLTLGTILWSVSSLHAQTTTGTITGTLKDRTGAVIPGAKVRVTNPATALERETTTNDSGDYTIPLLPPATYSVAVEK